MKVAWRTGQGKEEGGLGVGGIMAGGGGLNG